MSQKSITLFIAFFLQVFLLRHAQATKLAEIKILDQNYIMLHFIDSEVIYKDDGLGSNAFTNAFDQADNSLVTFGNPLDITVVGNTSNWVIKSTSDLAYGTVGINPDAIYRKSKTRGHAQLDWNVGISDYNYTNGYQHYIYLQLPSSLVQGSEYTIEISGATQSDLLSVSFTRDIFNNHTEAIHVNLHGYSDENQVKSADLYHWMGDGGARDYSPFEGNDIYIYNIDTQVSQLVGTVSYWQDQSSSDVWFHEMLKSDVWNADFTGFNTPGNYRIAVEGVGCSEDFKISSDIYKDPFAISTLGFFYMRIGQDSVRGITPVPRRPLLNPKNSSTRVILTDLHPQHPDWSSLEAANGDLWDSPQVFSNYIQPGSPENNYANGGHSDAADLDRHLGHVSIVYDMLYPYILTDGALSDDDLGIAESGNGIPDILDEARYEVDFWLSLKDGVGYGTGLTNPDDSDNIYQGGASTMSAWANAANCAMLAYSFDICGNLYLRDYYQNEALKAYNHALAQADQMLTRVQGIGDSYMTGGDFKMLAAAYLYNLTGNTNYENVVQAQSVVTGPNSELIYFNSANPSTSYNQIWATAAYLTTTRTVNFPALQSDMSASVINTAKTVESNNSLSRPSRRITDDDTGYFHTIQNAHRTILAHKVATSPSDKSLFLNGMMLEADWGLGRNPLNMIQMTTGSTVLADKRSVSQIYTSGYNDGSPDVHPGHTPYLNTDNWFCGAVNGCPSHLYNQNYPNFIDWPVAEDYYETRYIWAHTEFTPQQTMRGKMALYGYLYGYNRSITPKPTLYNLIVNDGIGDGAYQSGDNIIITADAAPPGFVFDQWVGDVGNVDDIFDAMATITIPNTDPTIVSATYKPTPIIGTGVCGDPIQLSCGDWISFDSGSGTDNFQNYGGAFAPYDGPDIVHEITIATGDLLVELLDFTADLDLFVLDGCDPASANLLAESTNGPAAPESIILNSLPAGTYYIHVDGFGGANDTYSLRVQCTPVAAPCNSLVINANPIPTGTYDNHKDISSSGSIIGASVVVFKAEDYISLQSQFDVNADSNFHALIENCASVLSEDDRQ